MVHLNGVSSIGADRLLGKIAQRKVSRKGLKQWDTKSEIKKKHGVPHFNTSPVGKKDKMGGKKGVSHRDLVDIPVY